MKQQASIADVDVGLRIGGKCDREILPEGVAKCSQASEASTKLIVEGGPCDRCGLPQNMKAIGKPDIYVDRHRASRNLADRGLAHRKWVFNQASIEPLVELNSLLPETQLRIDPVRKDGAADEAPVHHERRIFCGREKSQSAQAKTARLFANKAKVLAAIINIHLRQPIVH